MEREADRRRKGRIFVPELGVFAHIALVLGWSGASKPVILDLFNKLIAISKRGVNKFTVLGAVVEKKPHNRLVIAYASEGGEPQGSAMLKCYGGAG